MRKHFGKWLMLILSGVFLFFVMGCDSDSAEVSEGKVDYYSETITVTYVDEAGNILDSEEKGLWNSTINIILDYKKTGYISTYFDSKGVELKSTYLTDSDCTITVKFTPITYTVKFEKPISSGTFSGILPESIQCEYDKEFTLPENKLSYTSFNTVYKACGWTRNSSSFINGNGYSDGEKVKNLTTEPGTVVFYPLFRSDNLFKLGFYQSDSMWSSTTYVYAAENEIIGSSKVPTADSKTGYSFDGYYIDSDDSQTVIDFDSYQVTADVNFKPKYSLISYPVTATFSSKYGTAPEPLTWTYSYYNNDKTDITTGEYVLTTTGYDFDGWYEEGNSYQTHYIYHKTANNITLTAKWTPWTATVSYYRNNSPANGSMYDTTVTYSTATKLSKNEYYLAGYEFTGWNTKADGTGTAYADEASYVWTGTQKGEKINLYAQWKPIQTKMTVSISAPSSDSDLQLSYDSVSCAFNAALSGASVFTWYVDGRKVENETSSSLSAYVLSEGQHSVMVTSEFGGKTYGQTLSVNVTVSSSEE